MNWFAAHAYLTGLIIAGVLLVFGAVVVVQRAPLSNPNSNATWNAGGIPVFTGSGVRPAQTQRVRTEDLLKTQTREHSYVTLPSSDVMASGAESSVGWDEFLTQLMQPQNSSVTQSTGDGSDSSAYSFIPQGLISVSDPTARRSERQEALYQYGNSLGSYILGFDDLHHNMIQTLKDAYQDRGNAQKVAAASQIGRDYIRLGEDIGSMDVPKEVGGLHQELANAYKQAGELMIAKLQAQTDQEFLAAIETYNAGVDEFQRDYIALITLFEVAGVQFGQSDPGRVFMFQATATF